MSILDCVRAFNGLIKQCFAWLIEASSQAKIPSFFLLRAAKSAPCGTDKLFEDREYAIIIRLICSGGP